MTDEPKTAARFVGDQARSRSVKLGWPIEFGGRIYEEIYLKRLRAAEVAAFQDSLKGKDPASRVIWPIFFDAAEGAAIPFEVMEALDDDDRYELDKAALDFLPRRFLADPSDSPRESGETTGS